MDTHAARRARRKEIQADLAKAYTDEEACPPEWVELLERTQTEGAAVKQEIRSAAEAFVHEPDIKVALAQRERSAERLRGRIERLNGLIRRLNLIAPNGRFTRGTFDGDELLRPLYRSERSTRRSPGDQSPERPERRSTARSS